VQDYQLCQVNPYDQVYGLIKTDHRKTVWIEDVESSKFGVCYMHADAKAWVRKVLHLSSTTRAAGLRYPISEEASTSEVLPY